jgi:hypothetical protein
MAVIEVEVGEDGAIAKVPEQVQKLIDAAYGRGQAKATDEGAARLKAEIEKYKKGGLDPAEREKLLTAEKDLSRLNEELAIRDKRWEDAQKIRDERHASEIKERDGLVKAKDAEIQKRTDRVRQAVMKEVIAVAAVEGARKESLPELEVLLGSRIGLDDALQPIVTDAAGKPALDKDGNPVTVEGYVRQYLADHQHHVVPASGRGGGAQGGRSLQGGKPDSPAIAAAMTAAEAPTKQNVRNAWAEINKAAGA